MNMEQNEAKEHLFLFWEEYMAGGFKKNSLTDEAKTLFCEVEGYMTNDEEIPGSLIGVWASLVENGQIFSDLSKPICKNLHTGELG